MKITKSQLKQIIKEELEGVLNEGPPFSAFVKYQLGYHKVKEGGTAQDLYRRDSNFKAKVDEIINIAKSKITNLQRSTFTDLLRELPNVITP